MLGVPGIIPIFMLRSEILACQSNQIAPQSYCMLARQSLVLSLFSLISTGLFLLLAFTGQLTGNEVPESRKLRFDGDVQGFKHELNSASIVPLNLRLPFVVNGSIALVSDQSQKKTNASDLKIDGLWDKMNDVHKAPNQQNSSDLILVSGNLY